MYTFNRPKSTKLWRLRFENLNSEIRRDYLILLYLEYTILKHVLRKKQSNERFTNFFTN